ncbi:MAG: flagellar basal body rod protein FlgB [Proteobacteria bacterium]|nr:flagellar basal body rod protein FlgB [Pseudomonadota bacterium]
MIGKLDDYLRFNEVALGLREQRQQLLASNIANADTPNYKARDFDFNSALQGALSGSAAGAPGALLKTDAKHFDVGQSGLAGGVQVQFRNTQQGNIDGNTVDMDVERNQFTDNALRYEAGLTLISAQIKNMLAVIQG